jgi:hypothetical protein
MKVVEESESAVLQLRNVMLSIVTAAETVDGNNNK